MTAITLTEGEQAIAAELGEARYRFARSKGLANRHGRAFRDASEDIAADVEGVGAELAVARAIGRDPSVVTWQHNPNGDVGDLVQARHTRNGRYLLLHGSETDGDEDPDGHDYFLVTGPFPAYFVVGWTTGRLGKIKGSVRELQRGRPCICVDQADLLPVERWRPRP